MSGRPRSRQREEDEFANVEPPPEAPGQSWIDDMVQKTREPEPMEAEPLMPGEVDEEVELHPVAEPKEPRSKSAALLRRLPPEIMKYLGALRACPAPAMARKAAGLTGGQLGYWRRVPGFSDLEREATSDAKDTLLASAYNRAVHGVVKPVFQLGNLVGYEREYSDKLMEVLLKGMREEFKPEPPKETAGTTNIVITDPAAIADVVRRLSPTSQPKQAQAIEIEAPKPAPLPQPPPGSDF